MKARLFAVAALATLLVAGASTARADEKADALLKEVAAATKATKTLTANFTFTEEFQGKKISMTGTAKLKRPNLARIEMEGQFAQTIASDGKTTWTLMKAQNQYMKTPSDADGKNLAEAAMPIFPLGIFFDPTVDFFGSAAGFKSRSLTTETGGGAAYQVVEVAYDKPFSGVMKLYVGPDKLVHRVTLNVKQDSAEARLDAALQNVKTGVALAAADFAYQPPKTAKLFERSDPAAKLVAVGKDAPNFTLPTPTGGQVALGETLKGKKAVLVNFWFHG